MPNDPTGSHTGPWRLLILDRDPHDPKWIMATITTPADVRPATIGGGDVFPALADAGRWVRRLLGRPSAELIPLHRPEVWQIDEQPTASPG